MKHEEHEIQVAAFKILRMDTRLSTMFAIPNATTGGPRQGRWLKDEGRLAGVWDVFLPVPIQVDWGWFHGLYIEVKAPKKKLTKEQAEFGIKMHDRGYGIAIVRSVDEFTRAVRWYLNRDHRNTAALTECHVKLGVKS
jgi:hypothetical protein